MFTGIIEETGLVEHVSASERSILLKIRATLAAEGIQIGDSLAVNGCCLTVTAIESAPAGTLLSFDLLRETWQKTNLQFARTGARANLERSLPASGRLHGHFVTGHIDALAQIETFERRGSDWFLRITAEPPVLRYIAYKGSIAVDGISLTVAEVDQKSFAIWIIPHTLEVTALKERKSGDWVNLETDILAKYVEKLTSRPAQELS